MQSENDVHSFGVEWGFLFEASLDKWHTDCQNIPLDSSHAQSVRVWVESDVHPKNQIVPSHVVV
jgi:hypothetical protein